MDDKILDSLTKAQKEALAQRAAEILESRRKQNDYLAYCKAIQPEHEMPQAHHKLIIEKLQDVANGDCKRLMIFMPPGSAKSTYASKLFPAWYLSRYPLDNIISASHTLELAETFGRWIRSKVQTPEHMEIFPEFALSKESQAASRWDTDKGGGYYAVGVGGSITGRRADGAIIDDPVKGREEVLSKTIRDKTVGWYTNDFWTRLKPEAWVIVIMTRWHMSDLAGYLLDEMKNGGEKWEVLSLSMEADDDDPLGRKKGEPLWPEWFTDNMRKQAKRDPYMWQSLYQQRPVAEGGGRFKREWIRNYDTCSARRMNVAILVDPADSKATTADYTCMMVVGMNDDHCYYVLEIIRDRLNLKERTDALFNLHKKWRPQFVGYEKIGMQADIQHIEDKQNTRNYRFEVTPLNDGGSRISKEARIERLVPLFAEKRIWLPLQGYMYTDCEGNTSDLVRTFIEEEYLSFPVSKHDDMIDCLSKIYDPGFDVEFPDSPRDGFNQLEFQSDYGGSWMSR